jgi:N-acetylated-alpha-linked acidic dipeptidase
MPARSIRPLIACALLFSVMLQGWAAVDQRPLMGFTREGSETERSLEARFDASLRKENLREWMKRLSARPHNVGSPYGKENAEFMAGLFRSWGYDAKIEQFKVLFPTPRTRVLELVAPEKFTARLTEEALPEDSTSGQTDEQLPTYNAYSIDGDVTGQLVYVNYGVPRDYEVLAEQGIDVKGKIVIARYGGSWRGIKPKVAAEHGAIGCLIYSDPRNDGYTQGDVYPKGPWRNENGVQRGSVADMPLFPGDPLTPDIGASEDAKRLAIKDAPTLTKIPVLPISYGDALPLLKAMDGPVAPDDWRGSLPIPYHLGAGPATVHLKLQFNWNMVTAYDVIARLQGGERPDEWVIRGNHHDAWVNGAEDPISGLVSLLEEARAVGEMARTGWKPRRTIIYAAWDGEEPGLLGSTEWVETHAQELTQKAAIYINSDTNARGFLSVGGSHTLEKFINEVARDVTDPEKKISVEERARALQMLRGNADERREARERSDLRIEALGSGSDFTPFVQHLGIASLNLGFGGEGQGGSYHSIYDSFDHYTRFIDPNFDYGIALAQTAGRAVLRFADADMLPFEFTAFADTVGNYVREVTKLADDSRETARQRNQLLRDKVFESVADPTRTEVPPPAETIVPYLNFAPLQNALTRLQDSVRGYNAAIGAMTASGKVPSVETQRALDEALIKSERAMTLERGLPRRPWFKHQIYAPGFYTGYGVKTLPGVREAIEQKNWQEASSEIEVIARTLDQVSHQIDAATARLKTN